MFDTLSLRVKKMTAKKAVVEAVGGEKFDFELPTELLPSDAKKESRLGLQIWDARAEDGAGADLLAHQLEEIIN